MKNYIKTAFATAALACMAFTGTTAQAAEDTATGFELPVDLELSIDLVSMYHWRGLEVVDDPVMQPSFTIGKGFESVFADGDSLYVAGNWWANFDLTDTGQDNDFSEHDWTFSIDYTIDRLALGTGIIYYYFPRLAGDDDTTEIYFYIGYDVILAPTFTAYYDVDSVEGWYLTFDVSHSFALDFISEKLSLDLGASVGYMDSDQAMAYYGTPSEGFTNITGTAGLSYVVNDNFSLGWYVTGNAIPEDDLSDAVGYDSSWYTGVNATFSY